MVQQIRQHKLAYLTKYASVLEYSMMDRVGNITLLNSVRNILVSKKPLEECMEYQSLNQYLENQQYNSVVDENSNIILLHFLSGMVNIMGKGQDNQVDSVISYYPYLEQNLESTSEMESPRPYSYYKSAM